MSIMLNIVLGSAHPLGGLLFMIDWTREDFVRYADFIATTFHSCGARGP